MFAKAIKRTHVNISLATNLDDLLVFVQHVNAIICGTGNLCSVLLEYYFSIHLGNQFIQLVYKTINQTSTVCLVGIA